MNKGMNADAERPDALEWLEMVNGALCAASSDLRRACEALNKLRTSESGSAVMELLAGMKQPVTPDEVTAAFDKTVKIQFSVFNTMKLIKTACGWKG